MDTPILSMKSETFDRRSLECAQAMVSRIVAQHHDRPSLVSRIACEIGAEIIEGLLLPRDDLNSVELSKRYSTSRTPVREALMLLEKEGLVAIPPRKRPRVAAPNLVEIHEIYRARAALFQMIAEDVASTVSEEGLASLRVRFREMERAFKENDLSGYVWANVDFYDVCTQLANNAVIKRILDSLLLRTARLRRISLSCPGRMARSCEANAQLLRAFENRDAQLAAALMRANHMDSLTALERYLSQSA
jgi:DNA-binding GntR family transcriptional regulator